MDLQGDPFWTVSDRGHDLINARIGKPVSRATGIKHLKGFLERVIHVERSRGWPLRVTEVEIFGDFLDSGAKIMDIELVVDLEPKDKDDAGSYRRTGQRFRSQRDELWAYLRGGSHVLTLYQDPHKGMAHPHKLLYMRSNILLPLIGAAAEKCFPLEGLSPMASWDEYVSQRGKKGA